MKEFANTLIPTATLEWTGGADASAGRQAPGAAVSCMPDHINTRLAVDFYSDTLAITLHDAGNIYI